MTVLCVSMIVAWIILSTLLVVVLILNSSRISRADEPFEPRKLPCGRKDGDDD
jgi:hypothetical protein